MRRHLLCAPVLSLLALAMSQGQSAVAAARPSPTSFSMTVTPPRIVVSYTPGQTVTRDVEITNTGVSRLDIDVLLSQFGQASDGSMQFSTPSPGSGAGWVAVAPRHATLAPHATQAITISITVPGTADAGERQIGVILRAPSQPGPGNIRVTGAVGVELLVGAPGPVLERTALGALHAPGFSLGGPIPLSLAVSERGNVHREFVPPHQLVVDADGGMVPFPSFIVLRGVTRTVETTWKSPPLACVCTVSVATDDGQGHTVSVSARIVIFPAGYALGALALLVGVTLLTMNRRKARRLHRLAELERVRAEGYARARSELDGSRTA